MKQNCNEPKSDAGMEKKILEKTIRSGTKRDWKKNYSRRSDELVTKRVVVARKTIVSFSLLFSISLSSLSLSLSWSERTASGQDESPDKIVNFSLSWAPLKYGFGLRILISIFYFFCSSFSGGNQRRDWLSFESRTHSWQHSSRNKSRICACEIWRKMLIHLTLHTENIDQSKQGPRDYVWARKHYFAWSECSSSLFYRLRRPTFTR